MAKKGSFLKFEDENSTNTEMQKMLVKKLHNFSNKIEETSRIHVLNSTLKTFLKSLNELVRLNLRRGVTPFSYQQLHLDLYFTI